MSRSLTIDDLHSLETAGDPQLSPDGTRVAFTVTGADKERDRMVTHVWVVSAAGGAPAQWTRGEEGEGTPRWAPDGSRLAFVSRRGKDAKPQVFAIPATGGEPERLTNLPGGVMGYAWSPDGTRLAVLGPVAPEQPEAAPIRVRRLGYKLDGAGFAGELRVHLFVQPLEGGDLRQLTEGDFSVGAPAWSPDGTTIAFTSSMHDDRDLKPAVHLFTISAEGGEPRSVVGGTWMTGAPLWTNDGAAIVFTGQERFTDVQSGLFTVSADGGEPKPLLPGFDRNVMVGAPAYPGGPPKLSPDGSGVVFCARIGGCTHLFAQSLQGGAPAELISGEDDVVAGFSTRPGVQHAAVVIQSPDSPGDVHVVHFDEPWQERLTELSGELLNDARIHHPQRRRFRSPDGIETEGFLWGAEPGARKPLLLNVHGGPHNAWTPALSSFELHQQELVEQGWTVLALNPRGSDGYGEQFMRGVIGGWGLHDEQDFHAAIDALVEDGSVDPERLAVTGYSYGGFMTSWLIGHTRRFSAAVSGGAVTNLESMYGTSDFGALMAESEYGAEPHEDRELYERMSPMSKVAEVRTPTLILHGERDDRCDLGQSEELFAALRKLGQDVEMVVYPGASHLFVVTGRPSHQADYQKRLLAWVTEHVPAPARAESASAAV